MTDQKIIREAREIADCLNDSEKWEKKFGNKKYFEVFLEFFKKVKN